MRGGPRGVLAEGRATGCSGGLPGQGGLPYRGHRPGRWGAQVDCTGRVKTCRTAPLSSPARGRKQRTIQKVGKGAGDGVKAWDPGAKYVCV